MTLLNTIKRELNALGIKPKKSLGQNFLVNEGTYKKIVAALEIKKGDTIVEVGPGLGTLTGYLAESGAKVIAVEKDKKLAAYLRSKFSNRKNVKIIEGDILKFTLSNYKLKTGNYKLVGNIPYYLTSRLTRTVFEKWPRPEKIVLMVQKEVAQRMAAKPPDMSLLAVSVQYYSKPEIMSYVSAGSFYPPPKVNSAIIKLVSSFQFLASSKNSKNYKLETKNFFQVVRAGFGGKRKQLINNLVAGLGVEKKEVENKLLAIDINPHRRAETLTVGEWKILANILLPLD